MLPRTSQHTTLLTHTHTLHYTHTLTHLHHLRQVPNFIVIIVLGDRVQKGIDQWVVRVNLKRTVRNHVLAGFFVGEVLGLYVNVCVFDVKSVCVCDIWYDRVMWGILR
jgi:hypothetical protein